MHVFRTTFVGIVSLQLRYVRWLFLLLSMPVVALSQSRTVSGTVSDAEGKPIESVSIALKGTRVQAFTDLNGKFRVSLPSDGLLVFSSLGYQRLEVATANRSVFNVTLKSTTTNLEEVVVNVGYGERKRSDLTGAVGSASVEDMAKAPVSSFTEALQGRVAGVVVSSGDGQPGSAPEINIRGVNSISQSNSPLWVVDGFPLEDPENNAVNPNDIESIDVLKDASATAIYGARGSNGVIVVTTKKGKIGTPVLSFNAYSGVQDVLRQLEVMSPYEFVRYQFERDSLSNRFYELRGITYPGYNTDSTYLKFSSLEDYRSLRGIDYQKSLFRVSPFQNYDVSLSGGTLNTRYYISGNIFQQEGIVINSGFDRYQGRVQLDQSIGKKLKLGINSTYSRVFVNGASPTYINSGFPQSTFSLFTSVWANRPVAPLNSSGEEIYDLEDLLADPETFLGGRGDYRINPIQNQLNTTNTNTINNLIANGFAQYNFTPSLNLRINGGIVSTNQKSVLFYNENTNRGNFISSSAGPNGQIVMSNTDFWSNENILTYNKQFNRIHSVNATAVVSAQGSRFSSFGQGAKFLTSTTLGVNGLEQGTPVVIPVRSSNWNMASLTGRINYDFKKRYFVTATYRADGSSKFSEGNKWSYFPSMAVKWRFATEPFLKKLSFLSDGTLRMSTGLTGNNRVSDFSSLSPITEGTSSQQAYVFNGSVVNGAVPTALGNENLRWETTLQTDIGADLSFFKSRLSLTADIYEKTTRDLLLNARIPPSLGYNTAFKNVGSIRNRGLELSINSVNVKSKIFSWTSNFNISWNRTQVLSLAENQEAFPSSVPFSPGFSSLPSYMAKVGSSIGEMYGLVFDGVYQFEDFNYTTVRNTSAANAGLGSHYVLKDDVPSNGSSRLAIQPGDIRYKDLDGDGAITPGDFTLIGRGLPIHTGGFTNNFSYKNFDLNVFLQWSYGNDIQNANRLLFEGNANNTNSYNQYASYKDRWTPDNPSNTLFRTMGQGPTFFSSRTVEDGSYLRIKTIALGYNLPKAWVKRVKLNKARVYTSAQNLYTFTKYSGMDPEISSYRTVLTPGFDFSPYPRPRTVVLGLNLSL